MRASGGGAVGHGKQSKLGIPSDAMNNNVHIATDVITLDGMVADSLEAVIGAIYIDSGLNQTNNVIELIFEPVLQTTDLDLPKKDPKSELQEILQSKGLHLPKYDVISKSGADHNQSFEVRCLILDLNIRTFGIANSRKAAEVAAAEKIVDIVKRKLK